MLLEPHTWSLAQSSDAVLPRLSGELSSHTFPETHAAVIELATGIHPDVDGVVAELASLRNQLARELDAMGLNVAGAGTHPLTVGEETEVSGGTRYRAIEASLHVLARREPTMALHVHVGVPAPRGCDPGSEWSARQHPGSACALGQLSVLAWTRLRVRVGSQDDLPGFPPGGPAEVFHRLCRLRRGGRRADRPRGDSRSELLVVGRAASAGARDRRGARDGRPVSSPRCQSPSLVDPVAGLSRARERAVIGGAEPGGSRRKPLPGRARRDGRPADRPRSPAPDPGARHTRLPARRWPPVRPQAGVHRCARSGATPGGKRGRSAARARRSQRTSRPPGHDLAERFVASRSCPAAEARNAHTFDHPTEGSDPCVAGSHTQVPQSS